MFGKLYGVANHPSINFEGSGRLTSLFSKTRQSSRFWLVSGKKFITAPFLDAQELHSQSTWKANVCISP